MRKEPTSIDPQTLTDGVRRIFGKYGNDAETQELLRKFLDFHGKYNLVAIFSHVTIHLRGDRLTLYFDSNFYNDYFDRAGMFEKFKSYCHRKYNFKTERDNQSTDNVSFCLA